jgi:D-alanine-D-alanine ligase-like ATP-grasp enzyme
VRWTASKLIFVFGGDASNGEIHLDRTNSIFAARRNIMNMELLQLDYVEFPDGSRNEYPDTDKFSPNEYICREFVKLGFNAYVRPPYVIASRLGKRCFTISTETSLTSRVASRLLSRKDYARQLFNQAGLSVPKGYRFRPRNKDRALRRVQKLGRAIVKPIYPESKTLGNVVLKPIDSQTGKGVSVGVTPEQFETAWAAAIAETDRGVLVECMVIGTEARYLVVDGRCVAVCKSIPPAVYGDGKRTVRELIESQNILRSRNPILAPSPILFDAHRENVLRAQRFSLDSVPPDGRRVILDLKASIATGGEPQDITEQVHPTMKAVAEEIAVILADLDVVGVDIIARNHSAPACQSGYAIIEANTRPDMGIHIFPVYGMPVNVARYIAESCARRLGFGSLHDNVRTDS